MPHWPKPLGERPLEIDLELYRVIDVLERLGSPHRKVPPVMHVAGTNGKGSTIAFLRSILKSAGYSLNIYTSPHLRYFNERIVICNEEISDRALYDVLEDVRVASKGEKLTFFEGTTLAAILAFSRTNADFSLIETGMGGRLDATNVFPKPLITIITSIDLDHTEYLGRSTPEIAYEKSGIMKNGVSCVVAGQTDEVMKVIEKVAAMRRAPVFRQGYEWNVSKSQGCLLFETGGYQELYSLPNLRGDHQIVNAGNTVAAVTILRNKYGYDAITAESINEGLSNAIWPARLQRVSRNTNELVRILPQGWELYIDGAHNPAGAKTISEWLGESKAHIILGMTRGKDVKEFLSRIKSNIETIAVVCVQGEPRSQTLEEISKPVLELGCDCFKSASLKDAVQNAVYTKSGVTKIIICGSLFLFRDLASYGEID
ncbi:bifunctional folylpolyglutamate synthase/dihydrofolate synthase [Neorickettsia helminthoeca]|nr:folylpolyglutamate synthase/dihydrofolate synthase family protein [Neorickettsia helminthoeca]